MMRRALEALTLESDDALIAGHFLAWIDGESHVATAQQVPAPLRARDSCPVELRQSPEVRRGIEVNEHHRHRTVRLGLQLETALELQGRAEERR